MSFYTDWFIATEAEAENIAASDSPFEEWQSLSLRSIGEIDLMALSAILQGIEVSKADPVSDKLLFQGSETGPFVVRISLSFVDDLANIPAADRDKLAAIWSQSE